MIISRNSTINESSDGRNWEGGYPYVAAVQVENDAKTDASGSSPRLPEIVRRKTFLPTA